MPEDLNISEQQEPDAEFDLPTPHEDIQAAANAIYAIDGIDLSLISKASAQRVRRIHSMSLKIIYEQIKYIHDCIFFEEKEIDDDE